LGDSVNTIKENTHIHLEASRDVSLEINAEKTKYMITSRHPNSGQNQNTRTANETFGNVVQFKYLGMTLTNQNDIRDEIKSKIYLRECLLSFSPMSSVFPSLIKKLNIKVHKTVILPVVLYEYETLSFTLREEHSLRVFENRILRKIFGPKSEEDESWRKLHNDELHSLYSSPNIVRVIKSRRLKWAGHVVRMGEERGVYRILVGRPEGRDHWKDLDVGRRTTIRWTLGNRNRWDELD
jgi:hypothetical protein